MCDRNCFNCIYEDCIVDDVTREEDAEQRLLDNYARRQLNGYKNAFRYNHSEKRQKAQKRYNHSEKGRQARARYEHSEKGKATAKRKQDKRIASGKNAEACKRYYLKKKVEKVLKS